MFAIHVKGFSNKHRRVAAFARWTCEVCRQETDKYSCPGGCGTRRPE